MGTFLDWQEEKIGHVFQDKRIYFIALTHKSCGTRQDSYDVQIGYNNEKLEFRGDSILDFVLTDWMLTKFPDYTEGNLAKLWDLMAGASNLARISKEIGLDKWIIKKDTVPVSEKLLADTLEAVIGAIYLDGGLEPATLFIHRWITNVIPESVDYKTQLQEKTQKFGYTPVYETIQNVAALGNKLVFTAKLKIPFYIYGLKDNIFLAEGFTKKQAEQNVAKKALEVL
jgi:ribonuclease-3